MSNYNPYAPPTQDTGLPVPAGSHGATWNGQELVVTKNFTFPPVCLKCGSPDAPRRRTQRFTFTPLWARMMFLLCMLGGVIAVSIANKRATLVLPLCEACYKRWRNAQLLSGAFAVSIILMLILVGSALSSLQSNMGAIVAFLVLALLVALVVVMRVLRKRWVVAKKIDDAHVTLVGIDAGAGAQVAASTTASWG